MLSLCISVDTEFCPVLRTHVASWKGPLDGARDPPSISARVVDPAHSSRDVPVNLTLNLVRAVEVDRIDAAVLELDKSR